MADRGVVDAERLRHLDAGKQRVERAVANRVDAHREAVAAHVEQERVSLVSRPWRGHRRASGEARIDGRDQPRIVSAENDGTAAGRYLSSEPRDLALDGAQKREIVREARRQRRQHEHVRHHGGAEPASVPLVSQSHLEDQHVERASIEQAARGRARERRHRAAQRGRVDGSVENREGQTSSVL